jgi:hypothetical protein
MLAVFAKGVFAGARLTRMALCVMLCHCCNLRGVHFSDVAEEQII